MSASHRRTQIIIALFGLLGVLGTAIITNWDKFFGNTTTTSEEIVESQVKGSELRHYTIAGVWVGEMYQTVSATHSAVIEPFDVRLVLTEFKEGQICGSVEHKKLGCRGTLTCIKQNGNTYLLEQQIDFGKRNCANGTNKLVLLDSNTMERSWLWPNLETEWAKGTLKRIQD